MYQMLPFDDELLGSILSRTARQLGLPVVHLLRSMTGKRLREHSSLFTIHPGVAHAFRMTLEEFNRKHSTIHYAVAFMSPATRARHLAAVSGDSMLASASLSRNVLRQELPLRYCPCCVHEDLKRWGESYWRRSQQLPGVSICLRHRRHLVATQLPLQQPLPIPPPHEAREGPAYLPELPLAVALAITTCSQQLLNIDPDPPAVWTSWYRCLATRRGYLLGNGSLFGTLFARDVQTYFGSKALSVLDAAVDEDAYLPWPARLLRASCSMEVAPIKHVLLMTFLRSNPTPSVPPKVYESRRRGDVLDWPQVDLAAVQALQRAVLVHRAAGTRVTVKDLIAEAGVATRWRCSRDKLPRVRAWLQAFKCSPTAARQLGRSGAGR